jgi:hypothetical protein
MNPIKPRVCPHCLGHTFTLETNGLKDYIVCALCNFPCGEMVPFEMTERHLFPPEVCPITFTPFTGTLSEPQYHRLVAAIAGLMVHPATITEVANAVGNALGIPDLIESVCQLDFLYDQEPSINRSLDMQEAAHGS